MAKVYATSWVLGGTTRTSEVLTIPTAGVFSDINNFSIELFAKASVVKTDTWQGIFGGRGSPGAPVDLLIGTNNQLVLYYINQDGVNSNLPTGYYINNRTEWHYYAVTYANGVVRIYVDGAKVKEGNIALKANSGSGAFYLGRSVASSEYWNGLIDDLRISSRARTDAEIAAAYASGLPLPVDADTTYKLNFDGSLTPQKQALSPRLQAVGSNLNVLQLDNLPWAQLQYTVSSDGQTWGAWQDVDPAQNKLITVTYPGYYKVKANRSTRVAVKNWKKPFDQTDAVCGFVMAAS